MPPAQGARFSLTDPLPMVGLSPEQIVKMIGDTLELYISVPPNISQLNKIGGSVFLKLAKPKEIEKLVKGLMDLATGQVETIKIGGKSVYKMDIKATGVVWYAGIIHSHIVVTTDKKVIERFIAKKRASWVDSMSDKSAKGLASGTSLSYFEMDYAPLAQIIKMQRKGKSPNDTIVLKTIEELGTSYSNARATSHGIELNTIWTVKNQSYSDLILNFYKIGSIKKKEEIQSK